MSPFPHAEIIVERIGWLLFHSLWQFALIGIAAALLFWLLRGARPATRYALGLAFLAATVLAPIITWPFIQVAPPILATPTVSIPTPMAPAAHAATPPLNQVNPLNIPTTARNFPIETPTNRPHTITSAVAPPVPPVPWTERLTTTLNPWLETCVALWYGGVLLFSLRPVIGWFAQRRLRQIGTHPLTEQLAETWERASQRLKIRQRVQILQSTLAPGPMVVGYLRPVILLPTTVVDSLPARRIEAILLHELAHIRRHDWLVNTLQTLVETLMFYHPAVWWLSARIRHERELCCDEIAAHALGDRVEYGRALVDLETLRDAPVLALGAKGGSLLDRIRRLSRTEVPRSNTPALISLAVASLLLTSLGAWSVRNAEGNHRPEPPDPPSMSFDEQKAWDELAAMNLNIPEAGDRRMRLSQLKQLKQMSFPKDQIQQLRRQLQEPIRSMHPWKIPEEAWPVIARLESLERIWIIGGELPRAAFESMAKLPRLTKLSVMHAQFLPPEAAALKNATSLEELDVAFTIFDLSSDTRQELIGEQTSAEQAWAESYRKEHDNREHIIEAAILTDRMLQELRELPNLKKITLTNTSVSSRGAVAIAAHAGLEKLEVNFVDFSPEAARAIGSLKALRHFQVAEGATDETLSRLVGLTNLEFLQLWGDRITDAGTAHLATLQSLRYLNLYNSSLSDFGLLELAKLRHLKRLQLGSSKTTFTREGIAKFRRLRPDCELSVTEPKAETSSSDSKGEEKQPTEAPTPKPHLNTTNTDTITNPATQTTITGQVVDSNGKPVSGAFVVLAPTYRDDGTRREFTSTTDHQGAFRLEFPLSALGEDPRLSWMTVWAWKEGFAIGAANANALGGQAAKQVHLALPPPAPRRFRILDPDQNPVSNAHVSPRLTRVPNWNDPVDGLHPLLDRIPPALQRKLRQTSDAKGDVLINSVPSQQFDELTVSTEDFGTQHFSAGSNDLILSEVGDIQGVVQDTKEPVHLLIQSDHQWRGWGESIVKTDNKGHFHVSKFPVGQALIKPFRDRPSNETESGLIQETLTEVVPETNSVLVKREKGVLIRGRIVERDTQTGISNARFSLSTGYDEELKRYPRSTRDGVTDQHGGFEVLGASGNASLQVYILDKQWWYPKTQRFQVPAGKPEFILADIEVDRAEAWAGKLIDEHERPIAGVYVAPLARAPDQIPEGAASGKPRRLTFPARTNEDGHFSLTTEADANPDGWEVVWSWAGGNVSTSSATVISKDPLILRAERRKDNPDAQSPNP